MGDVNKPADPSQRKVRGKKEQVEGKPQEVGKLGGDTAMPMGSGAAEQGRPPMTETRQEWEKRSEEPAKEPPKQP